MLSNVHCSFPSRLPCCVFQTESHKHTLVWLGIKTKTKKKKKRKRTYSRSGVFVYVCVHLNDCVSVVKLDCCMVSVHEWAKMRKQKEKKKEKRNATTTND